MGDGSSAERIEMVAAYRPDPLRDMVRTAYSHLRSHGERHPSLDETLPPHPAGEAERLEAAATSALAELTMVTSSATVAKAIECIEKRAPLKGGNARALATEACDEYREAFEAHRTFEVAEREHRDHTMLRELLDLYGERYGRLKRERSALDFEDLELIARDLLAEHEGLREAYSSRFEHVLVDEFQDTNELQNELLELLARENLFRVGDENQSIYRFRHADVSVFQRHWARAEADGRAESITVNFRSRGEVLDAIDLAFERAWGERFEPLREAPGAREPEPRTSPCVELLVVDRTKRCWEDLLAREPDAFGKPPHGAPPWRAAEARLLAKRVDELTGAGPWSYGDVVMLFRATTAMGMFERALDERGIPVHVVGGRGYWGQQQVMDLRHWLAALANPLDGLAVYSVLASPLAGLSLDGVALIGLRARRMKRDPWWALSAALGRGGGEPDPELLEQLPARDQRRLAAFADLFEAERRIAGQVSLETLIDRAVTRTGYDRHLLALPGGTRRMANVRKLMRMAREFEGDEGRNLRGFIDALGERDAIQTREGEAPLEAEALNAVRMMTVHRAKGLEFPVVCLADLGKDGRDDDGSLRISEDGSVGLRLAGLGGGAVDSARLERIKAEGKVAAEAEERRIFYVAATRAKEHLVLSGATDLAKRPEASELQEPMRWIWRGFCAGLPAGGAQGIHVDRREDRDVAVRWTLCTPTTIDEVLPQADRAPSAPQPEEAPGYEQPRLELGMLPAPRALPVSRLSYSGLEAYRHCGYRFYLERALGLARVDPPLPVPGVEPAPAGGISALLRGTVVHGLLERLDFGNPVVPSDVDVAAAIELHGTKALPADVEDVRDMVERLASSPLRQRIADARRVRTELPFAFTLDVGNRSLLFNGVVDVHADEEARTLVVDWKSDALGELDPKLSPRSRTPLSGSSTPSPPSRPERSAWRWCTATSSARTSPPWRSTSRPTWRRWSASCWVWRGAWSRAGSSPSSEPHFALCADCPGRAALCVHDPELTLRLSVQTPS